MQIWFIPDLTKSLYENASYNDYKKNEFPIESNEYFSKKTIKGNESPFIMESEKIEINQYEINKGKVEIHTNTKFIHSFYIIDGKLSIDDNRLIKSDFAIIKDSEKIIIDSISKSKIFEIKSPSIPSYKINI